MQGDDRAVVGLRDVGVAAGVGDAVVARQIAGRSPHAIRGDKRLLNMMHDADPLTMLAAETEEQVKVIGKPNMMEAVAANMQKRAAVFQD